MDIKQVSESWLKKAKISPYHHFDPLPNFDVVVPYVLNPHKVARHAFYPFIQQKKVARRITFDEETGKAFGSLKKVRFLCSCAHIDSLIYSFYATQLNALYNELLKTETLDRVAVAYRVGSKWKGKNNVDFAKEVFEFLATTKSAFVMTGDLSSFFDNIDHQYLKHQLCHLLKVERLPDDLFAVVKSVAKYAYVEKEHIIQFLQDECELERLSVIKLMRERVKVLTTEEFKKFRHLPSNKGIEHNKKNWGIAQGTSVSPVLANLYMFDFDKAMNALVKQYKGLYRRYSDDFLLVLPELKEDERITFEKAVRSILFSIPAEHKLELQEKKTKWYRYSRADGTWLLKKDCWIRRPISFLGLVYDGTFVSLRPQTVSKYYAHLYTKARGLAKQESRGEKRAPRDLYRRYSVKGILNKRKRKRQRNLFSYIFSAQHKFKNSNLRFVDKIVSRHLYKIKRFLNLCRRSKGLNCRSGSNDFEIVASSPYFDEGDYDIKIVSASPFFVESDA